MNEREKQILKEVLKENLTLTVDDDGEMTLRFAGEQVAKTKKAKKEKVDEQDTLNR